MKPNTRKQLQKVVDKLESICLNLEMLADNDQEAKPYIETIHGYLHEEMESINELIEE